MSNHYSCLSTLGGLGASIVDGQSLTGIKNRVGRTSFLVGQKYGRNNNSVIFVSAKLTNLSGNSVDLEVVLAMWNKLSKKTGNRKRKVYPLTFSGTRNNITGCHLRNSNLIAESNEELCRNIKGMEWDAVGKKCKYKFLPTDPSKASRGFSSLGIVQDCDPIWTPDHRNWCGGETVRQSNSCGGTRDGMGTKPSKWSPERGLYCDDATFTQTEGCCRGYSNCLKDTRTVSGSNITPWAPERSVYCPGEGFTQTRPCCATGVTNTNNCQSSRNTTGTSPAPWIPNRNLYCAGASFTQTRACCLSGVTSTNNCVDSRTTTGTKNPPWTPSPGTKCRGVNFTQTRACCPSGVTSTNNCSDSRSAVGAKCCATCNPNFTLNTNTCTCECNRSCSADFTLDSSTCSCKCTKTCPYGQTLDSSTCTCKAACPGTNCSGNFNVNFNTCSCECNHTCSDNFTLDSNSCSCKCNKSCSVGQVLDNSTCSCKAACPGTTCQSPKVIDYNSCSCKCNNTCGSAFTGQNPNTCACQCNKNCPTGQALDSSTCTCSAACPGLNCNLPKRPDYASCSCKCRPCNSPWTGVNPNTCVCQCNKSCPGQQSLDSATCTCKIPTCNSGYTWDTNSNSCKCTRTCTSPQTLDSATCTCKAACNKTCRYGQTLDLTSCECKCINWRLHVGDIIQRINSGSGCSYRRRCQPSYCGGDSNRTDYGPCGCHSSSSSLVQNCGGSLFWNKCVGQGKCGSSFKTCIHGVPMDPPPGMPSGTWLCANYFTDNPTQSAGPNTRYIIPGGAMHPHRGALCPANWTGQSFHFP